jgi:hypothetical protein
LVHEIRQRPIVLKRKEKAIHSVLNLVNCPTSRGTNWYKPQSIASMTARGSPSWVDGKIKRSDAHSTVLVSV